MATNSYSNLKNSTATWNDALRKFGVVTVMNAKVYDPINGMLVKDFADKYNVTAAQLAAIHAAWVTETTISTTAVINFEELKVNEILALYLLATPIAELKYLKTANATQEGPTKTITGGQNASPLVKYGKTSRIEITNALGNAEALEALSGYTVEYFRTTKHTPSTLTKGATDVLHATNLFATNKTIIGDTFLLDANTNTEAPAYIIYYDFLPDSLINLTQDAEGDATVFDMNGDLLRTNVLIGDDEEAGNANGVVVGDFYAIVPKIAWANNKTYMDLADNGLSNQ